MDGMTGPRLDIAEMMLELHVAGEVDQRRTVSRCRAPVGP